MSDNLSKDCRSASSSHHRRPLFAGGGITRGRRSDHRSPPAPTDWGGALGDHAPVVKERAHAPDLAGTVAQARVDPTLEGRALQAALLFAIADRRGYLSWDIDPVGWLVFLHHADQETLHGRTLEDALAWRLVWTMAPELGVGQCLV